MQFGAMVVPRASDWGLIKELEEMGYHSVWTPDSQMIYSDTYAILALAAANTSSPNGIPICSSMANFAASTSSVKSPPAKNFG